MWHCHDALAAEHARRVSMNIIVLVRKVILMTAVLNVNQMKITLSMSKSEA